LDPGAVPIADVRTVSPGFFPTLRIRLRDGRLFTEADGERRVAMVSAATSLRLWPGQSALGRRFRVGTPASPLIEIVGIVDDVHGASLEQAPALTVYLPYWQRAVSRTRLSLAIRTTGTPLPAAAVAAAIHRVEPTVGVPSMRTMDDVLGESVALRRFQATLISAFGGAALLLAALGVYGVLAYSVSQRTREIGVRMALGARVDGIAWLIARQALRLLAIGLIVGLPVAVAVGGALRSLLYGVEPHDAGTLAIVVATMLVVTLLAALMPALRAASVEPLVALRGD